MQENNPQSQPGPKPFKQPKLVGQFMAGPADLPWQRGRHLLWLHESMKAGSPLEIPVAGTDKVVFGQGMKCGGGLTLVSVYILPADQPLPGATTTSLG